jgi:cell division protein FtsL
MTRRLEFAVALLLAVLVAVSGVAIVASKHEARRLFAELEELKREQDRLQVDWGRLQLEQSTLGTHARVERVARDQLTLADPQPDQVRILRGDRP